MKSISLISLFTALCPFVSGHNSYFTCDSHDTLEEGIDVMGQPVGVGSRSIVVHRGSVNLASPASYTAGEILQISFTSSTGEQVMESSGGAMFENGIHCSTSDRYRFIGGTASLVMPADDQAIVELWGGYALTYGKLDLTANKFEFNNWITAKNSSNV